MVRALGHGALGAALLIGALLPAATRTQGATPAATSLTNGYGGVPLAAILVNSATSRYPGSDGQRRADTTCWSLAWGDLLPRISLKRRSRAGQVACWKQ